MNKLFDLSGKNIMLTGSCGHIGRKLSLGLALSGAHVILNGRDINKLNKLKSEIEEVKGKSSIANFDICNENEIKNYFEGNKNLKLSGIVNNAYSGNGGTILTSTSDDYRQTYEVAVIAPANLIKYGIECLNLAVKADGEASIVNISSMYGLVSPHVEIYQTPESTNPPFYGTAKAALIQFTRYAAVELSQKKIRVNSITPGPFPSNDVQANDPEFINILSQMVPMKRIGRPEELVGAVQFLLSGASSFITGTNLPIDGGWTAW